MNTKTRTCRAALGALALITLLMASEASAQGSWLFMPASFTHNPNDGSRVVQYAQHEPVEGLTDPRTTISRYWNTRTRIRGADGSSDTIYEVRSFGNSLGGFDAQRERGYDAQLDTLRALRPFRHNPYLFFGGLQGYGYGFPGYPAPIPGATQPGPPQPAAPQQGVVPAEGEGCVDCDNGGQAAVNPPPGLPGTAYPYAPPTSFVAPYPYPFWGWGWGGGYGGGPWGRPGGGGRPGMGHPGMGPPGMGPGHGMGPGMGGPGMGPGGGRGPRGYRS